MLPVLLRMLTAATCVCTAGGAMGNELIDDLVLLVHCRLQRIHRAIALLLHRFMNRVTRRSGFRAATDALETLKDPLASLQQLCYGEIEQRTRLQSSYN